MKDQLEAHDASVCGADIPCNTALNLSQATAAALDIDGCFRSSELVNCESQTGSLPPTSQRAPAEVDYMLALQGSDSLEKLFFFKGTRGPC